MAENEKPITVFHVTTVPETLFFLKGKAAYMQARGIALCAVSSPGSLLDRFGREENVPVYGVPMWRRISPLRDAVAVSRITKIFRTIRPSIVHAHTPKGGLLAMISAFLVRSPVRIYHIHGLPFTTASGPLRRLLKLSEYTSCLLATRVFCVSESVRKIVLEDRLCIPSKITVPANGSISGVDSGCRFNPTRFSPSTRRQLRAEFGVPNDAIALGFVGRIVQDKGIIDLAAAWSQLRARFPQIHLLLVGKVEEKDRPPHALLTELSRDPRVHFVGQRFDMPRIYTAIDVLVLPTYREGLSVVLLEAAAMGIPVVATRVEGCTDAVEDGTTGTLVPVRCPTALADALSTYIENPKMRSRHGASGRKRVIRDYQPEELWRSYYQEYLQLLERRT